MFVLNMPVCLLDCLGDIIAEHSQQRIDGCASVQINSCAKSCLAYYRVGYWRRCCLQEFHHLSLRDDYRISCRTKCLCGDFIVVIQQSVQKMTPF